MLTRSPIRWINPQRLIRLVFCIRADGEFIVFQDQRLSRRQAFARVEALAAGLHARFFPRCYLACSRFAYLAPYPCPRLNPGKSRRNVPGARHHYLNADGSGVVQITNDPNVDASLGLDWR